MDPEVIRDDVRKAPARAVAKQSCTDGVRTSAARSLLNALLDMTTLYSIAAAACGAIVALVACSSSGEKAMQAAEDAHRYGWSHVIATYNTTLPVNHTLGNAPDTIAGHEIREIVSDPQVRVRGDGMACVDCHDWAKTIDRATFCAEHEPKFLDLPTSRGDGTDPPNAKPMVLKQLFYEWKMNGCPD